MTTSAPLPELRSQEKPPLYRDVRVIRWVGQIAAVLAVVGFVAFLINNAITNLASSGLPTGFSFLDGKFGSAIPGVTDSADLTVRGAFLIGYSNTVRVILFGIPGCTILGIIIGVMRLSNNVAARAFGTFYVELFRNIPALVWIYIAHLAIAIPKLPQILDAPTPLDAFVISNRGVGIPWFNPDSAFFTVKLFGTGFGISHMFMWFGFALLAGVLMSAYRGTVNAKTGKPAHGGRYGLVGFLIVIAVGHFVSGNALNLDPAVVDGRQVGGGLNIQVPYISITLALTLYTASHVAEVVRGAILAIHKGQTEAANAIALTTFQRYRFIILPQAFRIMIPPLANQYLNITKNSSLALAFSYVEIAAIFNRIVNNAAPAVQGIVILMALYLTFSLSISAVANFFNRRLALETR